MSQARKRATNRLLGYPDDARLLLINADDFGMYRVANEAVVRAFKEGIVRSTSLMVPCPGASESIRLLRGNPDIHFGVHLSVIRHIGGYRWGPLTPKARNGCRPCLSGRDLLRRRADVRDAAGAARGSYRVGGASERWRRGITGHRSGRPARAANGLRCSAVPAGA